MRSDRPVPRRHLVTPGAVAGLAAIAAAMLGAAPRRALATPRPGEPRPAVEHPLELSVYAGRWDFHRTIRFADDAVFGLRAGASFFPWLTVEVELDQITTQSRRDQTWARAISFAMHGRVEPWSHRRLSPGMLAGVSFMGTEDDGSPDALSEGFDVGAHLRFNAGDRVVVRPEVLGRYQSVRVIPVDPFGELLTEEAKTEYLWSYGLRLGVSVAF